MCDKIKVPDLIFRALSPHLFKAVNFVIFWTLPNLLFTHKTAVARINLKILNKTELLNKETSS